VKTGVQMIRNCLKTLDSGFRRNDGKWYLLTFYETITIEAIKFQKAKLLQEKILSNKRILAIDVGGGTQDIFLYEEGIPKENCVKMILPSQTRIIANRIARKTKEMKAIFLKGNLMGGGPCVKAIKGHISKGLDVYATELAAKTIRDNLAQVKEMGVKIVNEPPKEADALVLRDVDFDALKLTLSSFDTEMPEAFAIAVQDHGECIKGSNRKFRFKHWQNFLENDGNILSLAYHSPPDYLTRMIAVKKDFPNAILMDTSAAAILGALCDPIIEKESPKGMVIVNIGNQHTFGALVKENRMLGLFEHHTVLMNPNKLKDYVDRLRKATLTNEEVFKDNGHGCFIHPDLSLKDGFDLVSVTGPRRGMAEELEYYFAVPYGDMMLTGCFGLIRAARAC
jgi:uncharacterized protein (DUF1786 family)